MQMVHWRRKIEPDSQVNLAISRSPGPGKNHYKQVEVASSSGKLFLLMFCQKLIATQNCSLLFLILYQ
jgi:hypothetical protein